ncbi:MAG: hypothetical protein ACLP0J_23755 [Solirubrobacteraceae bacterium]
MPEDRTRPAAATHRVGADPGPRRPDAGAAASVRLTPTGAPGDAGGARSSARVAESAHRIGTADLERFGASASAGERDIPDASGGRARGRRPGPVSDVSDASAGRAGERAPAAMPEIPDASRGRGRERVPAPASASAGELSPLATLAGRPSETFGMDRGGLRNEPPAQRRASVSIGSIEVTVVSPSATTPPSHLAGSAAATAARSRPRPATWAAAQYGIDRLRDGRRRWYGTAQG